jgi:hypothetical protein
MTRGEKGDIDATLIVPRDRRIIESFRTMEDAGRVTCGELRESVSLTTCRKSNRELKILSQRADELERQSWPAVPNKGLVFDATTYTGTVRTFSEDTALSVQVPPEPVSPGKWHPFAGWTERFLSDLTQACAQNEAR